MFSDMLMAIIELELDILGRFEEYVRIAQGDFTTNLFLEIYLIIKSFAFIQTNVNAIKII